eukprot:1142144-Pelagomonas_calceolata.AAC.1
MPWPDRHRWGGRWKSPESDRTTFAQSLQDPAHGILQKLEGVLQTLEPAHTEAITFLNNLNNTSAKHTKKLETLCNKPATEAVATLAKDISDLIHSSYQVALKVCSTKIISPDNNHYNLRTISNKRRNLKKKLSIIRSIQSLLTFPAINQTDSTSTILQQNKENPTLHTAISKLKSLKLDLPPLQQLEELSDSAKRAITYIDETRNREYNNMARKKLQKAINTNTKRAHKEIFKDKYVQPRAGLQALRDPETGNIETEPTKQAQIVGNYYTEAIKAVNIKHGKYLPEEVP